MADTACYINAGISHSKKNFRLGLDLLVRGVKMYLPPCLTREQVHFETPPTDKSLIKHLK